MSEDIEKREQALLQARLLVAKNDVAELEIQLKKAMDSFERVNAELVAVYASDRWKMTEPLARLKQKLKHGEQKIAVTSVSIEKPLKLNKSDKNLLFFDRAVPMADKDAGSKAVVCYIKILIELGYKLYFIPEDFEKAQPYARELEQMGVCVLGGEYYKNSWQKWLKQNGDAVTSVVISRPNVAKKFAESVLKYTGCGYAYMGQDLHYLRMGRERDAGCAVSEQSIEIQRATELVAMSDAKVTFMYSDIECRLIWKDFGVEAVCVPLYFYDDVPQRQTGFDETQDLLFVGGFSHSPNVDAMRWFVADVLPIIKSELKDIRLNIVGANPTQEILDLQSESIFVSGFVSEEELAVYYLKCRVCVVPLRFGAGVKGKMLEAMYFGLPLVSTAVGVEGMSDIEAVVPPKDSAESFAKQVIELYSNEKLWSDKNERYKDYIQKEYSHTKAKNIMEKHL